MVGYHDNPEETRNAIDAEGFMHTGDMAVMDAKGYLQIVDRAKDMLIVGGFKVFSRKVEDVLAQHPAVEMVAIVGRPNPERPGAPGALRSAQAGDHRPRNALDHPWARSTRRRSGGRPPELSTRHNDRRKETTPWRPFSCSASTPRSPSAA